MISMYLGIEVTPDEKQAIFSYCQQVGSQNDGSLDKTALDRILSSNLRANSTRKANEREATRTIAKMKKIISAKGMAFRSEVERY